MKTTASEFCRFTTLEKAEVNRYVYHLTGKYSREGIDKQGLLPRHDKCPEAKFTGPVFANNTEHFEEDWYWFCLDTYLLYWTTYYDEYILHVIDHKSVLRFYISRFYDIWRIDTEKAGKDWYIDFVGLIDNPNKNKNYYVKSFGPIHRSALTLCALDIEFEQEISLNDGLHITYYNPIIPYAEYVEKHGFKPEIEGLDFLNDKKYFDIQPINDKTGTYWKSLNRAKFSLQDELNKMKLRNVS